MSTGEFAVSRNEFSGVPVFRPDAGALNQEWQQQIDGCHPLLKTVALAGVSAVQAGIRHSGGELEKRLADMASSVPLLGQGPEVTSAMFGPLCTRENGLTRFTHELPDGPMLALHGLHITAFAQRASRIARVEAKRFSVPVVTDEPRQAGPGRVSMVSERGLYDMFADPYFGGGSLKGIIAPHDIRSMRMRITDMHAVNPRAVTAATTVDMASDYRDVPTDEGPISTGLFATLGVRVSRTGLVSAVTKSGNQRDTPRQTRRTQHRIAWFKNLGLYAEYFSKFELL